MTRQEEAAHMGLQCDEKGKRGDEGKDRHAFIFGLMSEEANPSAFSLCLYEHTLQFLRLVNRNQVVDEFVQTTIEHSRQIVAC